MAKNAKKPDGKFIGSVKVGTKGQIVLPKEIRDIFGIEPGDTLVILADRKKGIALERSGIFNKIANAILSGHGRELYPDTTDEENETFANAIKEALGSADTENKEE